jgi:hypothetical protein
MLATMRKHRHDWVGDRFGHGGGPRQHRFTISCDECALQCTSACADCVVTFVLQADERAAASHDHDVQEGLVLDCDQARVVRLLGAAGLVPELKYQVIG